MPEDSAARRRPINQAHTTSISISERLSRLSAKREVLERFLSYARQLTQLQGSVEAVQQMLKPSQQPGARNSVIAEYCKKAESMPTPQLLSTLAKLDDAIAADFSEIVALASMSAEELIAQHEKANRGQDVFAAARARLVEFRRKGQVNVAIRYVLYERGIQQKAARLPVSQEQVAERLEALREEEHECRGRLKRDMEEMVADIDAIVEVPACPAPLKKRMLDVRENLQSSLTLLAEGRSLEDLPATIEVIVLSSDGLPAAVSPDAAGAAPAEPTNTMAAPEVTAHKRSFWKKLRIWLSSPWSVRWRDIPDSE
jgi:hypothetical protein